MSETAMTEAAVEKLYEAFRMPKPPAIKACSCCVGSEEICALLEPDLRSVGKRPLASYASSVFLTCGSEKDFRYFLPRIFETAAADKSWWPCPEVAIGKLELANWQNWRPEERRAVQAFLIAWVEREARTTPRGPDAFATHLDAIICGIAKAGDELSPYLERVYEYPLALAALYRLNATSIERMEIPWNAFWDDQGGRSEPYLEFLTSDRVLLAIGEL